MYQKHLTGLQLPPLEHIAPHGKEGFRQRRCFHHRQAIGNRQTLIRGHHRIFRVTTAVGKATDTIPYPPALNLLTHGRHLTGHFQSEDR